MLDEKQKSRLLDAPVKEMSRDEVEQLVQDLRISLGAEVTRNASLTSELRSLREKYVALGAQVEQEEEAISNRLLKKVDQLNADKKALLMQVEQEEEYLTNTLQKKLTKLQKEKVELESHLEQEQEYLVNRLQKQLHKLSDEKNHLLHRLEATSRHHPSSSPSQSPGSSPPKAMMTPRTRGADESEVRRLMHVIETLRSRLLEARASAAQLKKEKEERTTILRQAYDENQALKEKLARDEERFQAIMKANIKQEQEMEYQINASRRFSLPSGDLVSSLSRVPLISPRLQPTTPPSGGSARRSPQKGHRRNRSVTAEPIHHDLTPLMEAE